MNPPVVKIHVTIPPRCLFGLLFVYMYGFRVFVRDGIPSVADYNSTLMGVVVVVVVVVVAIFTMG